MGKKLSAKEWGKIKADYELGIMAIRKIAQKYGVAFSTLTSRAKRENWVKSVHREKTVDLAKKKLEKLYDDTADTIAGIIFDQRKHLDNFSKIVADLSRRLIEDELQWTVHQGVPVAEVKMDIGTRSKAIKNLADALQRKIELERLAYGLENKKESENSKELDSLIEAIKQGPVKREKEE